MIKQRIEIDKNAETTPTNYDWRLGVGSDHAFQILRKDVCENLATAHNELGFKYVRCHGIFDDDMNIIQSFGDVKGFDALPHAEEIYEVSFKRVSIYLDNVLSCGLKPFIELSFMPSKLASGNNKGCAYVNNITPPFDLNLWSRFITAFIRFLLNRYGKTECESWYFEVWNEPDLSIFFSGTMQDYFALYSATAKAIKAADENLRVGGPATSGCKWIKEFTAFCRDSGSPCDFISTHHYPGDAFGTIVSDRKQDFLANVIGDAVANKTDMGQVMTRIFYNPKALAQKGESFVHYEKKAVSEAGGLPVFIDEWNSTATFSSPVLDEKYNASFIINNLTEVGGIANGSMYWCCGDAFEEQYELGKPFHGGFGLLSNDGIPKPSFWAFKILSTLYPKRLVVADGSCQNVKYSAYTDRKKYQVLLNACDFDPEKDEEFSVDLSINVAAKSVKAYRIDDKNCNPKEKWEALGKPNLLTREQVKKIKSDTALRSRPLNFSVENNRTEMQIKMRSCDVVLIEIE